jgi:hypothetical protein
MNAAERPSWHKKLYVIAYTMFDAAPHDAPDSYTYWMTVFGTAIYCGIAIAVFLSLNLCTLPFAVFAEPIWRPKASFRLLRFPNGIPIIPFSVAVLLGYASYRTWLLRGALMAFGPWLFVGFLCLMFFGLSMAYNGLRGLVGRSLPK